MQTYSPYRVRSVQPEFLEKLEQPIAESTKGWTVRKRDGSIVAFDIEKIKAALLRCFNNVVSEQNVAMPDVDPILEYVVLGLITRNAAGPIDVEEIQRTIIAQLWITSLSEFAEHYQNYREDRRRARLNRPVPTAYAWRYPRTVLTFRRIYSTTNLLASFLAGMTPRNAARLGRKLYSTVSSLGSRIFLRSRTN